MADENGSAEKRRHTRHQIAKPVRARSGDREGAGVTRDISAGGASLDLDLELGADDKLELDIEDVGFMESQLARPLDDGYAVRFIDINDEEEEQLLAELEDLKSSIDIDEI